MKPLAAFAMMLACLTLPGLVSPAVAQRAGAAHGGFSGQSASAPRSSAPGGGGFSRGPIGVHPSPGPRAFSPGGPIGMRPAAPRGFNYSNSSIRFGSPYSPGARIPYNRVGASDPVSGRVHGPVLGPKTVMVIMADMTAVTARAMAIIITIGASTGAAMSIRITRGSMPGRSSPAT